jgi:hypothetical protein
MFRPLFVVVVVVVIVELGLAEKRGACEKYTFIQTASLYTVYPKKLYDLII